jgi:phospho-N-acetylmuramoyl-pentapeptide-transferase
MPYFLYNLLRDKLAGTWLFSVLQILDQEVFRALAAVVIAFAFVLLAGPRTIGWLRRKKIGDAGLSDSDALRRAAASKANTPTMGGVLIVGAVLASALLTADLSNFYVVMAVIVMLWLAALGSVDDWLKLTAASRKTGSRQGLYAWEKLVFQLGLGVLIGYFAFGHGLRPEGGDSLAHVVNLPFQKTYDNAVPNPDLFYITSHRWAYILVAVLAVAGMSNAVNITDGMDGLAGGVTIAVSLGLLVLALIAGRDGWAQQLLVPYVATSGELAIIAGAMAGACLGFLWFNCSPAQVFMGDTGSLALGGLLGFIALVIRQEVLLLLMSAVFLVEIGSVVLQVAYFKLSKGKRIFRCAPFHHHLHLGGWQEQQVVVRFWIISLLLVIVALAMVKLR